MTSGTNRSQEMKQALLKRTQESHEKRDDTGMFRDIFLDIEGLQKWKCKEGTHLFDVIPYKAGSIQFQPPNAKPGEWSYVLDLWVHGHIGPNQDSYICLARCFGLPCPPCEYREQLRAQDDYDEAEVKSLWPIRRVAYNIICYDDMKEEAKGIQVFLVSHFHMEKKLMAIAKLPARGGSGGGYVAFSDPDEGKSVQFERKGGRDNTEYLGHQFVAREGYTISDEILKSVYQLDQIVHIPTYEELNEAFYGRSEETPVETPPDDQAIQEEIPRVQEEKPQPTRLLRRGQSAAVTQPPTVPPITPPPITAKPALRMQPKPAQIRECPAGGNFGVDCEDLKECGGCTLWDDCSAQKDALRAKESPKPESPKRVQPQPQPAPSSTRTPTAPPMHRPIRGARR